MESWTTEQGQTHQQRRWHVWECNDCRSHIFQEAKRWN